MKILFCLGSMGKGGAERVIANLSNEFIKKYDVSIVVTSNKKSMYTLNDKIGYYTLDEDSKKMNVITRTCKRIIKLRKILKTYKPDIVISLLPEPTFRLMIAKSFLNIKTIISVRNDPNVEYNNLFKKLLVRLLYTKADGFIFQTPDAQKWFSKKIQDKSIIIPNPINENFICKPYKGTREKTIINVGRLNTQKNQKLLIDAFFEVHKKHSDYVLKIYGNGELYNNLKDQIKRLKLDKCVFLMGEVDDIKEEIYKAGMFVLSSDYEGMPNALMEAMALGLPCISTDCPIGGPKFLIENNKNGKLVKVNDKDMLVNSINELIEDSSKSKIIGDNANRICNELNPSYINKKWENYLNIIEKGEYND